MPSVSRRATLTSCPQRTRRAPSSGVLLDAIQKLAHKRRSTRARHPDRRPLPRLSCRTSTDGRCSAASTPRWSPAPGPTRCCCSSTRRSTRPGRAPRAHERPTDGTPVVDVDRGGKITWHGPGQLVGYPIVRLPSRSTSSPTCGASKRLLIDVLREYDVDGYRVEGRSGVWVRRPLGEDKIAAIGVRVQRGVTMHGFALNCDNSLAGLPRHHPVRDHGCRRHDDQRGRRRGCRARRRRSTPWPRAFDAEYAGVAA